MKAASGFLRHRILGRLWGGRLLNAAAVFGVLAGIGAYVVMRGLGASRPLAVVIAVIVGVAAFVAILVVAA